MAFSTNVEILQYSTLPINEYVPLSSCTPSFHIQSHIYQSKRFDLHPDDPGKENQIFKRKTNLHKVQSTIKRRDRLFLSLISTLSTRAIAQLTLVKPSTLLDWQRRFIRNYGTYRRKTPGRRPVSKQIKKLILEMKLDNQLWGCHRIADELKKLGIDLDPTTVNRIIQTFKKQGKIQPSGSWSRFLKTHWNSRTDNKLPPETFAPLRIPK